MIAKWDVAELEFCGHKDGNPFVDYDIFGEFESAGEKVTLSGFYDGDGIYRMRFMPSFEGEYTYRVWGSFSNEEYKGTFTVGRPLSKGPVKVNGTHFNYADGEPYYSVGTTCYGWVHQSEALRSQTLESLRESAFNKIRFCILPKHYDYSYRDPEMFPYKGTPVDNSGINKHTFFNYHEESPGNEWDFEVFNPKFFQNIDNCIKELMEMGIEADVILFHPYDRWGFSKMTEKENELYIKYVTARYSAYRNVWWSMANEYDGCRHKTVEDWEHLAACVKENDKYSRLISIHNWATLYDFSKPWVTHCSVQKQSGELELDFIPHWIEKYNKPVVIDEMGYEGNIEQFWGNLSPKEMTRRMWKVVAWGGYPGHSECYYGENIWWSHGGKLHGECHKRMAFLHSIMEECGRLCHTEYMIAKSMDKELWLQYFGEHRPCYRVFYFGDKKYEVKVIDTWNMTVENRGVFTGTVEIEMPSKEYMAIIWKEV